MSRIFVIWLWRVQRWFRSPCPRRLRPHLIAACGGQISDRSGRVAPPARQKIHNSNIDVRSLSFAASALDANSVMYLAPHRARHPTTRRPGRSPTRWAFLATPTGPASSSASSIPAFIFNIRVSDRHRARRASFPAPALAASHQRFAASANKGSAATIWRGPPSRTAHTWPASQRVSTGLANDASILPVRVCDSSNGSCPGDIDGGIVWASSTVPTSSI